VTHKVISTGKKSIRLNGLMANMCDVACHV